jgi:hypothetical protein
MKLVSLFLLAGAVLSAAPTAQVTLVNAGNPTADDGQYYVGPYNLSINGQNFAAMCVDVNDESNIGNTWTAYVSQVGGDISQTYHADDAVQYKEEAYLFSLITQPGADRVDIQHAAWFITDPGYAIDSAAQAFVTQAQANYAGMNLSGYELISDVNSPHQQEFIVCSPEPGSLALLGAGFLLSGLIARRKFLRA